MQQNFLVIIPLSPIISISGELLIPTCAVYVAVILEGAAKSLDEDIVSESVSGLAH